MILLLSTVRAAARCARARSALIASLVMGIAIGSSQGVLAQPAVDGGVPPLDAGTPPPEDDTDDDTSIDDEASEGAETESEEEDPGDDLFGSDATVRSLFEDDSEMAIPGVEVVAPRTPEVGEGDTGAVVYRLGEDDLGRFRFDNPEAVILQVPGAYTRSEDGFGLRPNIGLRGVSPDRSARITLMEDGVLFGPAPYAAPAAYYFPLMAHITGVELALGAASIPYGPMSIGGAIDFQNRPIPRSLAGMVDFSYGAYNTSRLHLYTGTSNDWLGFLVEGVYIHSDGFKHYDVDEDDPPPPSTGFDRGELILRTDVRNTLSDDAVQRVELRLGIAGEGSNETYLGISDEDFRQDPYLRYDASRFDRMEWWRSQIEVRHELEVGDGFVLRTAAYRHDFDRSWNKVNGMGGLYAEGSTQTRIGLFDVLQSPVGARQVLLSILRGDEDSEALPTSDDYVLIGTNARRFANTGIQTEGTGTVTTGPLAHRIRIGARLHHDAVDRHHTEDAFAVTGGQLVRASESTYDLLLTHGEALALSAHATYALTILDALTITPGVRTELVWTSYSSGGVDSAEFRASVLPGGSIQWQIVEELAVFAGIMRGFAPVAPGQAAGVMPEDAISYEAGVTITHEPSHFTAQATGYVNDYIVFLQQCSFSAGCEDAMVDDQDNGGAPIVAGIDARITATPTFGDVRIPIRASYTFTYSELREAITGTMNPLYQNGQPGDHLPYLPEHQVSLQVGLEMETFGMNVAGSYVSESWESVGQGDDPVPRTDAAFNLDASVYLQLLDSVRIYVRGENLTNTQAISARRPFGARPSRPLMVQGGLQVTYD